MSKLRRAAPSLDDTIFAVKPRKALPHPFVLDAIAALSPTTRPMFGCLAVYVEDRIVLVLRDKRDKRDGSADDGVWLATPTKAVFDLAYLSATYGRRFRRLPELELGRGYRPRDARSWASRIPSARIRAITLDRINAIERDADAASG